MKRAIVFILAILYITLTSGVAVNIHYCMGRLADVTYGHEADKKCDKCGMEQRAGCCKTEHKLIKADDTHVSAKSISAPTNLLAEIPHLISRNIEAPLNSARAYNVQYHSPPDNRSNQLIVFNSVFRI